MNKVQFTQIGPIDSLVIPGSKTCGVLFHGYGADAADLAPLGEALGEGLTWIFPNGIQKIPTAAGMVGRAWFQVDTQALEESLTLGTHRDMSIYRPADMEDTYQKIRKFLNEVESQYDEVLIGGFSQGAMLSTEMALRAEKKPKALIVLSGTLLCQKQWSQWAPTCQGLRFFQSHGRYDPLLSFDQAQALFQMFTDSHWVGKFHEFPGQHEIPPEIIKSLKEFLSRL